MPSIYMDDELDEFDEFDSDFQSPDYCLKQLRCKCGSEEFHVAQAMYHTEIRCVKCKVQRSIHDG